MMANRTARSLALYFRRLPAGIQDSFTNRFPAGGLEDGPIAPARRIDKPEREKAPEGAEVAI
jgi:hypothetical protein